MKLSKESFYNIGHEIGIYIIASFLIAVALDVFAQNASFAPGGVNGLAIIINHFTNLPIGRLALIINIPIVIVSYKALGRDFLLRSLVCMIINTIMIDWVVPAFIPAYTGSQLLASVFYGVIGGIGYALIYMENSSTGGSDFLLMMIRKKWPHHSIGVITQVMDGIIIALGLFAYKNIDAILYGMISVYAMSTVIDKIMYGANSGKLLLIVTSRAHEMAYEINEVVERGSTFLKAMGSYTKVDTNVVMCACSRNQVVPIKHVVKKIDPKAILIITESNEVYGEGFQNLG